MTTLMGANLSLKSAFVSVHAGCHYTTTARPPNPEASHLMGAVSYKYEAE
jgi:hypothetical protein